MAVSIQDLIDKRESMQSARKQTYDLETSAGTFTVKKPSRGFIIEAMELDANVTDQYIILNSVVSPKPSVVICITPKNSPSIETHSSVLKHHSEPVTSLPNSTVPFQS